jgi:hypothetical protein
MTHHERFKKVLDELSAAIRRAPDSRSRTRRMVFKAVPFDNNLTYSGVGLAGIMVPEVPADPNFTQAAFDAWAYSLIECESWPMTELAKFISPAACDWLNQWPGAEEQAVMLLWALGHAEGARVWYDDQDIFVAHGEHTFGVVDGHVKARFCGGKAMGIASPAKLLNDTRDIRTFSARFIALYREAYRAGIGETNALLALTTAYPTLNLWEIAGKHDRRRTPSSRTLQRWEKIAATHDDPIPTLYRLIVPQWASRGVFTKVVGNLANRGIEMTFATRQNMISRMCQYFHKGT